MTTSDQSYTAQSGDTLSLIAEKVYGNENVLELIYEFNRDAIGDNPEHIEPGMKLVMPLQTNQDFTNRVSGGEALVRALPTEPLLRQLWSVFQLG